MQWNYENIPSTSKIRELEMVEIHGVAFARLNGLFQINFYESNFFYLQRIFLVFKIMLALFATLPAFTPNVSVWLLRISRFKEVLHNCVAEIAFAKAFFVFLFCTWLDPWVYVLRRHISSTSRTLNCFTFFVLLRFELLNHSWGCCEVNCMCELLWSLWKWLVVRGWDWIAKASYNS